MKLLVKLCSADMGYALSKMERSGIQLQDVRIVDAYSVSFVIEKRQYSMLCAVAKYCAEDVCILQKIGFGWNLKAMLHRPVLVLGIWSLLVFSIWLQGRVLFVQVEGNQTVQTARILEAASKCGIGFGASSRTVRSEKMKNALLQEIPQLQWAGVNTHGCVAVISVLERSASEQTEIAAGISSIVAARDGLIRAITVLRGNAICTVGQAVRAGQVLISGYTDCGIYLQATSADGEVFAETLRNLAVATPSEYIVRGERLGTTQNYSLRIGKKRIFFHNSSGILDGSCARIYSEHYMTLPGGFVLPVAIACETSMYYETIAMEADLRQEMLSEAAEAYLREQMVSGHILTSQIAMDDAEDAYVLRGTYTCYEMIGQRRPEENRIDYESD